MSELFLKKTALFYWEEFFNVLPTDVKVIVTIRDNDFEWARSWTEYSIQIGSQFGFKFIHSLVITMWYYGLYGSKWGDFFYSVRNSFSEFLDPRFFQHTKIQTIKQFKQFLYSPSYQTSIRYKYRQHLGMKYSTILPSLAIRS